MTRKSSDNSPERLGAHERGDLTWIVGKCAHCFVELDPHKMPPRGSPFCSEHCKGQAEKVRYTRRVVHEYRYLDDPQTALVAYTNNIGMLALDLSYTRARIRGALRQEVLARNGGRCVVCDERRATEIDHIAGGSNSTDNLRGLCAPCHVFKSRGPIPEDLTRDGLDSVDDSKEAEALKGAWKAALCTAPHLEASWQNLHLLADKWRDTRFGWITQQILAETPLSAAHDEHWWRDNWRKATKLYRDWARTAIKEDVPSGS